MRQTNDPARGGLPPFTVLHLPHASMEIPADIVPSFCIDEEALDRELRLMSDAFTDRLFGLPPQLARTVAFPVSRLVVDPERFEDDAREPMAGRGMGVIYTRTSDFLELRDAPTRSQREQLLDRFYRPHHRLFSEAVSDAVCSRGGCLIIDGHSFPSIQLPYEDGQSPGRPEICIGTDPFHTPDWLEATAMSAFESSGWNVELNRPFSGSIVPMDRYGTDARVWSVMIEIRRDLYMDESAGEPLGDFEATRNAVMAPLRQVIDAAVKVATISVESDSDLDLRDEL